MATSTIRLFWWNEIKLQNKSKENYGDLLGKYLVEKISNKKAVWVKPVDFSIKNFFSPIYVTIGSILTNVNRYCVVWGSGIITKSLPIKEAKFLAVRGPQTRNYLLSLGYNVPEVYGDPALLLPDYYNPKIDKKYKIGIIPHYNDYEIVSQWFKNNQDVTVIDLMTNSIESTTDEILECEQIVSSSLHGIILAHAYQIPAVWQKFSDKLYGDDIKFKDYFESVQLEPYQPEIIDIELCYSDLEAFFHKQAKSVLPLESVINQLKNGLMAVCPFK